MRIDPNRCRSLARRSVGALGLIAILIAASAPADAQRRRAAPPPVVRAPPVIIAPAPMTAERIDRMLRSNDLFPETFTALATYYPGEYHDLVEEIVTLMRSNTAISQMSSRGFDRMRRFMVEKADRLATAPQADLLALARSYRDLSVALAADIPLCAQWSTRGLGPGSRPPIAAMRVLDHANAVQIHAIFASENGQAVTRTVGDQSDIQALLARIRSNDSESADLMISGRLFTATPAQQCRASQILYQSILELEPARGASVTALLLMRFFRPAPPAQPSVTSWD